MLEIVGLNSTYFWFYGYLKGVVISIFYRLFRENSSISRLVRKLVLTIDFTASYSVRKLEICITLIKIVLNRTQSDYRN